MNARQWIVRVCALGMAALLASCGGGGGGGGNDCSNGQNVFTNLSYPGSFDVYHVVVGTAVTPILAATDGIPASCLSSRRFSLDSGTLAPGLHLDSGTGTISGTPTAEGWYQWIVRVELSGFTGSVSGGINSRVARPSAYTFGSWTVLTTQLPINDGRLDGIGNALVLTTAGGDGFMTARVSTDDGVNWTVVEGAGRPVASSGFATTSSGTVVYGAAGQNLDLGASLRNDVWRFDGTTWSVRTTAAAFPARRDATMAVSGGTLFLLGGNAGGNPLNDVWRSVDGGQTWQQTAASFTPAPATTVCAVSFGGALVAVTTRASSAAVGARQTVEIWRSTDGIAWTSIAVPANSPLLGLDPPHPQCVAMGGRLYLFGNEDVVSSADLSAWQFEPQPQSDSFPGGGGAAIGGHLYYMEGMGTSQRTLRRSDP